MTVDRRYEEEFEALFARQGIKSAAWEHVQTFEELPVYSRYDELEFMTGLSLSDVNRQLIKASVCMLERITDSRSGSGDARTPKRLLFMVSVTDWHIFDESGRSVCNDGNRDYIVPHIYVANLNDSRMKGFDVFETEYPTALRPPTSICAEFVASALDYSSAYVIYQSPEYDWCPERIYVRLRRTLSVLVWAWSSRCLAFSAAGTARLATGDRRHRWVH